MFQDIDIRGDQMGLEFANMYINMENKLTTTRDISVSREYITY
jgi:hypothetical protein